MSRIVGHSLRDPTWRDAALCDPTWRDAARATAVVHKVLGIVALPTARGTESARRPIRPILRGVSAIRDRVAAFAGRQDSVITTAQCEAIGVSRQWVSRQVDSGRWQRVHHGVLVLHSGPVSWRNRARAALLYAGKGAALSHDAAAFVHESRATPPRVIDVRIPPERWVRPSQGIRIRRGIAAVHLRAGFPVVSRADTALDLLGATRSDDEVVGVLCAAVRAGARPSEILDAAERRPTARGRALALEMLGLVGEGIESPLEMRYHRDVERRHGLPHAVLQQRQVVGGLWIRADGVYPGLGVRRELDGEVAHPGGRTDRDTWRDNAVVIARREITLRYRWSHVAGTPCRTTVQVVAAFRSQGWQGTPCPCGPGCPVR